MASTRGISAGLPQLPQCGPLKDIGQVSTYLNSLGGWMAKAVDNLNRQAKVIPSAVFADLPPLDGSPRFIVIPDDPTYGQVILFNGVSTSGTATGWYRLIPAGTAGSPAASFPTGGTASQVLGKVSATDYDMAWQTPHYVPPGGTAPQALRKTSGTDYATAWADVHEVPAGGTASQVLAKTSGVDYATAWTTMYGLPSTAAVDGQVLVKSGVGAGTATWGNSVGTLTSSELVSLGSVTAGGTSSYAVFSSTAAYLGKTVQLAAQTTAGTIGTAGTASALPATPAGYLQITINGGTVSLPFYAP